MRALNVIGAAAVLALPASAFAADTLVVKSAAGAFTPGAATSWKAEGNTVTFTLAAGVDANDVATVLTDRLAAAKVSVQDGNIVITGVPADALLEQLATVSLSGDGADPLAELAGIGPGVGMDTPEGGGSIRASKPTETFRPRIIKDHDPKERVTAEVLHVERGPFPRVTLTLKLRSSAKDGPLAKVLRKGKKVTGTVVLDANDAGVDFAAAATQRNLAAYYLGKGDRVVVHAVVDGKQIEIDYVERQTK